MTSPVQKQKTYNLEELRKTHPKAYARWSEEEDSALQELYNKRPSPDVLEFEKLVGNIALEFGRRPNGIKARLAKYFADIPGWDYEAQKKRDIERAAGKKQKKSGGANSVDYQPSEESKQEVPKLDLTGNFPAQEALRIMSESQDNLFLTGEAGTGKSTLLNYFRKTTEKNVVVLAPTGVAALNVEGQTVHSFCAFGPDITLNKVKRLGEWSPKRKLLKETQTIIIDEISMVRADLLDCVDKFLRINGPLPALPFGGIQMVFIGDLYQLPPVDKDFPLRQGYGGQVGAGDGLIKEYQSPYFFDARCFKAADFKFIELKTIYRQKDQLFKDVLNAVRNNAASSEHLQILNRRSRQEGQKFSFEKFAIYLTPHNRQARQVNEFFLQRIGAELKTYTGIARGKFEDRELPTELNLQLKIGAQIMMLNNDQRKRWVNGTMGKIIGVEHLRESKEDLTKEYSTDWNKDFVYKEEFNEDQEETNTVDTILVELETGETVEVLPHTWEMFQFVLDKGTQKIDSKTTGTFTQYPFKLAWAVTIHKAQGKTFDKVYIDLSSGTFAHGQLYVAL